MFLGSFQLNGQATVVVNTHDPLTGAEAEADGSPTYRVYEQGSGTALLSGTLALFDDANTIGCYGADLSLLPGSGFEAGKAYTVRLRGVVQGIPAITFRTFQVEAAGGGGGATAEEIADAVAERVLETGVTWEEALRGILAQSVGDITNASGVQKIKSTDGTKDRATATIDAEAGTRTVTARDLT